MAALGPWYLAPALMWCGRMAQEYEPFYGDFGPLNLGHSYNFCMRANELVQVALPPSARP